MCRGRRFDPGGEEEGSEGCFSLSLLEDGSVGSSSGADELDSSSVSSSSHLAASNCPSDTEEACSSSSGGTKMSRRQRKNKNKSKSKMKGKSERQSGGPGQEGGGGGGGDTVRVDSTRRLFERLGKPEDELHRLLLPLCCSVETLVLNGYPFTSGGGGVHVFRPSGGYTTLAAVLGGAGAHHPALLEEEAAPTATLVEAEDEVTSDYSEPDESLVNPGGSDCCGDDNDSQDTSSGISSDSKEGEAEGREWWFSGGGEEAVPPPASQRVERCKRCLQSFTLAANGARPCEYHPRKVSMRQDGALRYLCCNKLKGVAGCTAAPLHVYHNLRIGLNGPLEGYASTRPGPARVVGLDCEMVFTSDGFELARVTAVAASGRVLLDAYVKPRGRVLDYNTQFSGITAQHMSAAVSFAEARERLLAAVTADTVLVGHSLEGDLSALRLLHGCVVDTALLFKAPQHHGSFAAPFLPVKQSLKALAKRHLARDIQTDAAGHDSLEDASVVLDLVLNHFIESHKVSKVAPLPPALKNM